MCISNSSNIYFARDVQNNLQNRGLDVQAVSIERGSIPRIYRNNGGYHSRHSSEVRLVADNNGDRIHEGG